MGRKPAAVQPEQMGRAKAGGAGGSRRDEDESTPGPSGSGNQLTGQPSPGERRSRETDELKHLQDSLSGFFTPTTGRRIRLPPRKFEEVQASSDSELNTKEEPSEPSSLERSKTKKMKRSGEKQDEGEPVQERDKDGEREREQLRKRREGRIPRSQIGDRKLSSTSSANSPGQQQPSTSKYSALSVDVDLDPNKASEPSAGTSASDSSSPKKYEKEKLVDSLSPYFSATSEKRRTVQKGEFAQLSGRRHKEKDSAVTTDTDASVTSKRAAADYASTFDGDDTNLDEEMVTRSINKDDVQLKPVVGRRGTQNSASAALFTTTQSDSNQASPQPKRTRTPKTPHTPQSPKKKSHKAMHKGRESSSEASVPPRSSKSLVSTGKKKLKKYARSSSPGSYTSESRVKEEMDDEENEEDSVEMETIGGIRLTEEAQNIFNQVYRQTQEELDAVMAVAASETEGEEPPHWPQFINFGKYRIKTWYSAPYPQEYAHVPNMYICEFCLKYMKSSDILKNHQKKCDCRFPPGNEIYRDKDLSVFEVDGNLERIYCQNLCLLAKLFIDHKTLYYDVEPFLFYVATKLEYDGFHFVGYFSKEKYSAQKFNLSCIVTLPCFQGQGYGRFLIDFSYLLSRQEKLPGTPERPLSDLGRVAYSSYWKSALFEYFHEHLRKDGSVQVSMTDIANATGITFFDVCETLDALGWFVKNERGITLDINWWMVEAHWKKMKADKRRIWLSERALKWTPTVYTPSKDFAARSPLLSTPKRSPVASGSTPTGVSLAAVGSTIKKGLGPGSRGGRKGASVNLKDKFEKDLPSTEDSTGSDNDEAKPKQNKKSNCRDRFFPGRAGRRDDSPDEDDQDEDGPSGGGKPQQKSSAKKRGRPPVSTSGGGGGGSSGNYRRKAPAPRTANAGPGTGTGTSTTDRSAGRKTAFEHPFGSSSEGSSEISSDSDELDSTYNLGSYHGNAYGSGNGGGAGRKPQKGKPLPNQQRKKRIPMKKPPGKSPGKVFPPNFGTRTRGKEQNSNSSKQQSSKSKEVQILKGNARCESSSTIPAIDSSTEAGTSGLVSGAATTSGRCHDIEGEDDIVASIPSGPVDRGPPPSSRVSRSSSRLERPLSRESSASGEGYFTDHHHSGACSDSSSQYDGSRGNTPRPIGDRVPDHEDAVNMGGDPDEDGPNRCDQEDNEPPPNLQMETYANVPVRERGKRQPSAENSSSDEAPPNLQAAFDPNEILDENDPRFSRVDGNSTDDEAPPQLSPVGIEGEIEPVYEDPEPPANVLDHRPSAPAKLYPVEQEEQLQHQDEVVQQTGIQEQQQMPEVQQQQVQPSCGSMGPFSQVGSHSMECMPSSVMHSTTPQQPYPGSLKQTTPGSVPSCQMQQSQTPDQQIAFMSPQVQQQGAICPNKQPNSVSSVHSQHNNSHEMIAGPLSQQGATFHSDPSTPLRSHHGASFGSPPQPIQASTSRQSAEGPANVSGHRRSGGGTSVDPVVSQQAGNVSGSSRQKSSRSSHHHPSQQTQLEQAQMVAQQQMVQQINLQQQGAQFYGIYGNYAYPNPASFYPPPTAQFEQFYHQYAQGYPSSSHSMYNQGAIIPPHPSFYPSAGTPNGFQAGTSFGGSSGSRGQGGVNPAAAAAAMNLPRYPPGAAHNDVQAQMNAMLPYGMYYQPANASNQFFGKQ